MQEAGRAHAPVPWPAPHAGPGTQEGGALPRQGRHHASRFAYVYLQPPTQPGQQRWCGLIGPSMRHPRLATPSYAEEEVAARAVDR